MELNRRIAAEVCRLVNDLVADRIDSNVQDGRAGQYSAEEIRHMLDSYPGRLTLPPSSDYVPPDMLRFGNQEPVQYLVHFDLWYDDCRSDLTLLCLATVDANQVHLRIDDIHVM